MQTPHLDSLSKRGQAFLGTRYAILGGAMSWVSERNLVAAISNAGGFGVIACGSMTPALLDTEITATQTLTKKPFGVNLITMHPDLDALIDVCVQHAVGHVALAGGLPKSATIQKLCDAKIKVLCFAPTARFAQKLVRMGAGALIIEGHEAGGHVGPVSTSILAQEILPVIKDVPVFVAGGIGRGELIATYLKMGASGAQLGTRFVCAEESIAHPNFKSAFIKANARDAITSIQIDDRFPVIPVRALSNDGTQKFMETQQAVIAKFQSGGLTQKEAQLEIEHFWAGALRRAVIDGDVETGSIMAGQSVGMVNSIEPLSQIMHTLVQQAEDHLVKH